VTAVAITPGVASTVIYNECPGKVVVVSIVVGIGAATIVDTGNVAVILMPACIATELPVTAAIITAGQAIVAGVTVAGTDGVAENTVVTPIVAGVAVTTRVIPVSVG
tara:strand:+ start:248 stop:568 length:321 start_codon:yes stop_codon:yes gene_type:complete